MNNNKLRRTVRVKEALERLGCSRSTLYDNIKKGVFPRPHKLFAGGRAVGFWEDEFAAQQEAQANG
jgi:predicted DNA-binding transcriptional regulator AlpA